jgi:hypothetical protein
MDSTSNNKITSSSAQFQNKAQGLLCLDILIKFCQPNR